jgi:hypothetical protein
VQGFNNGGNNDKDVNDIEGEENAGVSAGSDGEIRA